MTKPKAKLVRGGELEVTKGAHSFTGLLRQEGDDIRRDVVLNPEDSTSGRNHHSISWLQHQMLMGIDIGTQSIRGIIHKD
jgi:hypothetical protein